MSDNITQITELNTQENVQQRRPTVKRVVILSVVILAVCCLISLFLFNDHLNVDTLVRGVKYISSGTDGDYGTYSFDSHSSNCYRSFGDGLAVASIGGLSIYNENGEEAYVLQSPLDLPAMMVKEDMAVAYDVGGNSLLALREKQGEVLNLEMAYPILDADLSDGGAICLSSSESGYKSVLSAYNERQELIYRWLSSSTYFPLCAISSDAKILAAIAVGQSEGAFESSVYLFRTDSEEIQKQISLGSDLIFDLVFLEDNLLCAVGETGLQFVSIDGDVVGTYSYTDDYLKDFDFGADGFLTLATNKYRAGNRFSLVTVNERGKELGSVFVGKEILDLSACGRYIAALTPGKLTVYTQSLAVYYETTEIGDANAVVMREDGTVLLISGGEGKLFIP